MHELAVAAEPSAAPADMLRRLEALRACLAALQDWFRTWGRVTAERRIGLTFAIFIQLVHAIAALFRLSTADRIPAWNPAEVKTHLDLLGLLDRAADDLAASSAALEIVEDDPGEESSEFLISWEELPWCFCASSWGISSADHVCHSLDEVVEGAEVDQEGHTARLPGTCRILCIQPRSAPIGQTHACQPTSS